MNRPTPILAAPRWLEVLRMGTPAGVITVLISPDDGVVRAAGFRPTADLLTRLPPGYDACGAASSRGPVADAVVAYGDGDLTALDAVPVAQPGGPFMLGAWRALRAVPAGTTTSYTELAAAAGRPAAVRAAGAACARNLIALFVPCHRVLRRDGSLGGYLYGLATKKTLLDHEGAGGVASPTTAIARSDHRQTPQRPDAGLGP